jgi:ankyrin repeat protein
MDVNGKTALVNALLSQSLNIAKVLISKIKDPNVTFGDSKITALQICASRGYTDLVTDLINQGADVNMSAESTSHDETGGFFPLYNAAKFRHYETVTELLSNGADVNKSTDLLGYTALHLAAEHDDAIMVQQLIQFNANLNARDALDRTPLHIANIIGSNEVARVLLQNGADPSARDMFGVCAAHASASSPGQVWLLGLSTILPIKEVMDRTIPVPHKCLLGQLVQGNTFTPVRIRRVSIYLVINMSSITSNQEKS